MMGYNTTSISISIRISIRNSISISFRNDFNNHCCMGFCFSIFSISIRTSSSVSIRVNIIVLAFVLQSSSAG